MFEIRRQMRASSALIIEIIHKREFHIDIYQIRWYDECNEWSIEEEDEMEDSITGLKKAEIQKLYCNVE